MHDMRPRRTAALLLAPLASPSWQRRCPTHQLIGPAPSQPAPVPVHQPPSPVPLVSSYVLLGAKRLRLACPHCLAAAAELAALPLVALQMQSRNGGTARHHETTAAWPVVLRQTWYQRRASEAAQ